MIFFDRDYALEKSALEDNILLKKEMKNRDWNHFKEIDKHLSKPITIKARQSF